MELINVEGFTSADAESSLQLLNGRGVDISFEDLTYTTKKGLFTRETKEILRGVNGCFRAGELTVIVGQSGAGKSTLMDILAGYSKATSGRILVNGKLRNESIFRRISCYIMQDDLLQPLLTVKESLIVAAKLKLGSNVTSEQKETRVNEIIDALGLTNSSGTKTGNLSGGQRKRLAVALELINDPQVMFLDEPTSGLDSSNSLQLVWLLRKFAHQGRTLVISIHQPGAKLLELMDCIYGMCDGNVIYNGSVKSLLPYLECTGQPCPPYHNPIDFLIELLTEQKIVENLVKECDNGRISKRSSRLPSPDIITNDLVSFDFKDVRLTELPLSTKLMKAGCRYSTSYWKQFSTLFMRSTKVTLRDPSLTTTKLGIHFLMSLLIGTLYFNVGQDASHVIDNFRFISLCAMFIMFTAFSGISVNFPLELPTVRREHFNSWYCAGAYFSAQVASGTPVQAACTAVFVGPVYLMTAQPLQIHRIILFFTMLLLIGLLGSALGILNGAIFDVKNGVIFGPFLIAPFLIFSGLFLRPSDAPVFFQWLFSVSYFRHGIVGLTLSIFGYDRQKLNCAKAAYLDICYYNHPKHFLQDQDMEHTLYYMEAIYMMITFTIFVTAAYIILKYRLKHKR